MNICPGGAYFRSRGGAPRGSNCLCFVPFIPGVHYRAIRIALGARQYALHDFGRCGFTTSNSLRGEGPYYLGHWPRMVRVDEVPHTGTHCTMSH